MKYFTLQELCNSATAKRKGIDNTPDESVKRNLTLLVENILDPLREAWGEPIIVTSGYRCGRLNKAIGGAKKSQHMTGHAADIRTVSDKPSENRRLFEKIRELKLPYDQLIDEYGYNWVHVSYSSRNRRQILHIK